MENMSKSDSLQESQYIQLYIDSMSAKELIAYTIAKAHLGSSFEIEKSVGYIKWKSDYLAAVDSSRL
jgi:Fe-S cluster assembly iron-binding protein IscA